jgi:hypothetical protein
MINRSHISAAALAGWLRHCGDERDGEDEEIDGGDKTVIGG